MEKHELLETLRGIAGRKSLKEVKILEGMGSVWLLGNIAHLQVKFFFTESNILEIKAKIVSFFLKKKNCFEIIHQTSFFWHKQKSTYKITINEYNFNFKTALIKYDFMINFQTVIDKYNFKINF